jgi:hypothetical protein
MLAVQLHPGPSMRFRHAHGADDHTEGERRIAFSFRLLSRQLILFSQSISQLLLRHLCSRQSQPRAGVGIFYRNVQVDQTCLGMIQLVECLPALVGTANQFVRW